MKKFLAPALVPAFACALPPTSARAHFTLDKPASWMSQDALGSPQKLGPCGDESGGTATGAVTVYAQGETISVTVDEKIFHPGHYRIAISPADPSGLPPEPVVTPGATPCGSVPVQSPPMFPVLADGVFEHSTAFSSPQTTQVTLPAGFTCDHCTLQVIEFMSDHPLNNPGGCFYHHCATISVGIGTPTTATATAATGSGASSSAAGMSASTTSGGSAGGSGPTGTSSSGCKCSIPDGTEPAPISLGALGLLAVALGSRRAGRRQNPRATRT